MQSKIRHSAHQEIHIGEWNVDRLGVKTGSVQRRVPEGFTSIDWTMMQLTAAPAMGGVPCVGVSRNYDNEKSLAIYTYTYEGVDDTFSFGDAFATFELDLSMSEDPIETHPSFAYLKKKYGWDSSRRRFPEYLPGTSSGSSGLSTPSTTAKQPKRSPLYGAESYLTVGGIFRKTYVRSAPPTLRVVGRVVASPPGIAGFSLPMIDGDRNWLVLAPKLRRRGNVVEITEESMLSGPRGWIKDVYSASKLAPADGASADSAEPNITPFGEGSRL